MKRVHGLPTAILLLALMLVTAPTLADELVVYSSRSEQLIKPLFEAYTHETGTTIRLVTGDEGPLLQRLKSEDAKTSADVLITVDAGNLWNAARAGLLQYVDSKTLKSNIPEQYRDPDMHWFGLSLRARAIVYSTERVKPTALSTYEALGSPVWRGRLLLSTSKKIYNQALVAMLLAEHGETVTEVLVRSWVSNLAAEPLANDTRVMEAILAGQGDVGVINTYYFGRLLKQNPELKLALYWPNQETSGVYVDVSGAGITRYTKHRESAIKLLEWLSSEQAQHLFAEANDEYPVNPRVEAHPYVAAWGQFKISRQNLAITGLLQETALRVMDRAGYR